MARIIARRLTGKYSWLSLFRDRIKSHPSISSILWKSDSSSSSRPKKILSLSMLLLQDGLDVQELPVIIRRTDQTMYPFTNHINPSEEVRPASAEDETFQELLQQCSSVNEVCKLLEIPGDKVTGYSAAYALQRMCQLKEANRNWDDLDTFVCTAVINELYSTLRKEVSTLSNDMMHSLVKCFLNSENFSDQCAECVLEEIEKRIGDSKFSIPDLCALSRTIRTFPQYGELENLIWIHIGNSYTEIDASNVAQVWETVPLSHKYITKILEKQTSRFWWNLTSDDIVTITNSFMRLNTLHGPLMQNVGRWVHLNLHTIKETDFMQIITAFINFNFSDVYLIKSLERYVPAKGTKVDTNLLALVMEYCRGRRYLSPKILDAAAMHFCENGDSYSPLQTFTVLRPFGFLNYLPPKPSTFLLKVETVLSRNFSRFETMHITELLCCFTYVKKVPVNFAKKILATSFLSKLNELDENQRNQAGMWLEMFQSAIQLDCQGIRLPLIFKLDKHQWRWKDKIYRESEQRVSDALEEILGPNKVRSNAIAPKTVYLLDFEICVKNRKAVPISKDLPVQGIKRLAVLIQPAEHYCINSQQLLGEHAMKIRHLQLIPNFNYAVVELLQENLQYCKESTQRAYIKSKLEPYIDFD